MSCQRKLLIGLGVFLLVGVIGLIGYENLFGFTDPLDTNAIAPTVEAATSQQRVYRIDAAQSQVRYSVEETFVGQPISTAVGTTQAIAGDILIDMSDFSQSRVGTIVINVEQFASDSGLRDRRIRREYLESSTYPEAVFQPRAFINFPDAPSEGTPYTFEMVGDLTIKQATHEAVWTTTATLDGETVSGSATTSILMSTYDVGPISIAGLVETANEVQLSFDFVAVATTETQTTNSVTSPP